MATWKIVGIVALVLFVVGAAWYGIAGRKKRIGGYQANSNNSQSLSSKTSKSADEPRLRLKHIGIELGPYDAATGMAGDLKFIKGTQFNRLFMSYGFHIEGGNDNPAKDNPQPTFIAPLGTKARALVDGVVADIPTLWSGDVSIQVSDGKNGNWLYETEHVINPTVNVGDRVTAGQVVGEVSDYDKNIPGFGIVEIGILRGGNPPSHVCPFAYLDPAIEADIQAKLTQLYADWEAYMGDTSLYGDESPLGCVTTTPIEG